MKKTTEIEPEEHKILAVVLKKKLDLAHRRTVVIKEYTSGKRLLDEEVARGLYELFGIRNFIERNREPHELENRFPLETNVVLLSEEEIEAGSWVAASGYWNWDKFRSQYDDSPLIELSRVSFDQDNKWAYLFFRLQANSEVGFGSYFLLENRQGSWGINSEFLVLNS